MATQQTTYSETVGKGVPGMIADSEGMANRISRTAAGNIGFGQPVVRSGAHNCAEMTAETLEASAAVANAGNTGTGTMGTPTITAGAKEGTYRVTIIAAATNAGTFEVEDPDGVPVGVGTVAVAFSHGGVAFTLSDATDFVVGDGFSFTVQPTTGTNILDLLGIAILDKTLVHTTADRYEQYDSVAILPGFTPILVTCGATVVAGDRVYWNATSKKFTNTTTDIPMRNPDGGWWQFDEPAADTELVWIVRR